MEEEWRDIAGYAGKYQVSNLGNVKSLNYKRTGKEKILRPQGTRLGYLQIGLFKGGECKRYIVHRLVLSTFSPVENMDELQVNHINEKKDDNRLENLEWCTCSYNNTYNDRHKRVGEKLRGRTLSEATKKKISGANSKPIVQIDASTNKVVNVWGSSYAAEREGFNPSNIIKCCKNKFNREGNNIYKGYKWQYLSYYISQIDSRIKKIILFDKEFMVN